MSWWQYLMLVNIYLLLFYGFYALLLSRERFFHLNRIYLVSAALMSFLIPGMQSQWVQSLFITQKVQYTIYNSPVLLYRFKPVENTPFTVGQVLALVYLAVTVIFLARFAWQLIILNRTIRQQQSGAAYSFFKKIKIGEDRQNREVIATHEDVHARQWHSADVLVMEILVILNWFNPVVYFYRFAIKHIHEFIADKQAIETGIDRADYALILLSETFDAPAHRLVTPFFNKSLLKQRILMLQKNKSSRAALIKYLLSAPLFMLMLILSSATVNDSKTVLKITKKVELELQMPANIIAAFDQKHTVGSSPGRALTDTPNKKKLNTITIKLADPSKSNIVFTSVEHVPEFPGGLNAFSQFLSSNIRYPKEARDKNTQGRVIISFIVETDGSLSNIKVARGIGDGADEEALRVLALSPKWKPGTQNGLTVRVAYSVPINFTLEKEPITQPQPAGPGTGKNQGIINEHAVPDTEKSPVRGYHLNAAYNPAPTPLYIVDGVERENLNSVNVDDIKSISVLKDKSSTAIYGAKGANGVIVVITKGSKSKSIPDPPLIIKLRSPLDTTAAKPPLTP